MNNRTRSTAVLLVYLDALLVNTHETGENDTYNVSVNDTNIYNDTKLLSTPIRMK